MNAAHSGHFFACEKGRALNDKPHPLTDEQIEAIAERAAEVALERVYTQIGKSVVSKVLWLFGAGTLTVVAWMNGAGHFPGK